MSQYLPEHQAPQQDPTQEGDFYQPSDDDVKTVRTVEKLFGQAKKYRKKYDEKWNDFYNMYRGRQWKEHRPSYRHSDVMNLIFRDVQSNAAIQMDTRPKFEFLPQNPQDQEISEILNQVCEADWAKYNWTEQLTEMIFDSNIFGTGIPYVGFDRDAENGIGAICIESQDCFYIFPDPAAKDANRGGKYFIKAEPMNLEDIKKKWSNGKYVPSDVINIEKLDLFDKDRTRLVAPSTASVIAERQADIDAREIPQALVITCWFEPGFEIEETKNEEPNPDGTINVSFVQKKKYPKGRKVTIASKVLLDDDVNEFYDTLFPFARLQNYVNPRQFWGISDVEQLESPQKVFNKIVCFALDVMTLMGNPIWVVGESSGIDTDNLFNQPGLIVEPSDISQVRREPGVELQPYVLQLIDRIKLWFDDISGSSDVSRGVNPTGVTAASAIDSLQEATQTRLRQKARNLDACLQNMGQLYLSRVFQFYDTPRVFRLTGKDGVQQFFKFHIENTQDPITGENQKVVHYRPYVQSPVDGQHYEGDLVSKPTTGLLDVKVSTGSSLPFAKAEKEQRLLNFFDRGIIDAEEVLKGSDYPNWQAVLQRVQQNQAMQAQAQAQSPQKPQ